MQSIQTNHPVMARALEFSQEAQRMRQLAQEAAAKVENPLKEQPANRVTFSQEAQTRLNEEKTHAANLVKEVRVAVRAAAAEERSQAMREEKLEQVEARIVDQNLRQERDVAARQKREVANKALADNAAAMEKTAKASQATRADATEKAIEQQHIKADAFIEKRNADDFNRTFVAKTTETSGLLEKQKRAVVVKNLEASRHDDAIAIENSRKVKAMTERSKAETAKAMKMYQHIDSMS